jgi:acetyl-CoA acetyltransferase
MPPCKGIITRRSIMRESIKDKVAIVGMGCTQFGERWDADVEDLIKEASLEALEDAGVELKDIQAGWVGTGRGSQLVATLGGGEGGGVRN